MTNKFNLIISSAALLLVLGSCQKIERPELGEFDTDDNQVLLPGNLRFFTSFNYTDGPSPRWNAKDSISNHPALLFPLKYEPGINGNAIKGDGNKGVSYLNTNDFPKSTSFTVAFWEKHDGVPESDAEFVMSIPSTQGHWSNAAMLLIFDHKGSKATKDSAVIKLMVSEIGNGDHWFELTGDNRMPKVLDNQWHHLAFAYDETTSNMKIYRDGVLWSTQSWAGHGPIKMDYNKVSGFYLGDKTTDWGKAFNGSLDQFRLYNTALSAAEIQKLYQNKL